MYANPETLYLWSADAQPMDFDDFKTRLARRIAHRWDHYSIFQHRRTALPVGFAYCYNNSDINNTASVCICLDSPFIGSPICLEAAYLYFNLLFDKIKYRKIYAEVFEYNDRCLQLIRKLGFQQEGCLSEHQYRQGKYWNQYILSFNESQLKQILAAKQKLLERLIHDEN